MTAEVFDDRACQLGEGPLWHPERGQLFWFDIMGRKLMTPGQEWAFPHHVSAAGWVDRDTLLIASKVGLHRFDLTSGATEDLLPLEAEDTRTRSNDGRADPQGGFWIGTMGKNAEPDLGAIYRYYRGELRQLFAPITISNSICFAPDGPTAYFSDTVTGKVMRTHLDDKGWPRGAPEVHLDLRSEGLNPDGAVVDARGNLWLAEWGAFRVSCYGPDGDRRASVAFPAAHTSCPAFGGEDMTTLFCTSALQGVSLADRAAHPMSGMTFAAKVDAKGQLEHRVIL